MTVSDWVTGGGSVGLVGAMCFVIVQIVKAWTERGKSPSAPVTDATAANAILRGTVEAMRAENVALMERVQAAERRVDQLQVALDTERQTHRLELEALRRQLDDVSKRLSQAEARYRDE